MFISFIFCVMFYLGVDFKKVDINMKLENYNSINKIQENSTIDSKDNEIQNLNRIWTRFYKVDSARTRSKGGTGIGLALVKAIMTKYNSNYGVSNKKDGVEFYFEITEANNK